MGVLSIFSRLMHEGAATAASLAAAEHVSQQAIAQSLAGPKTDGLVSVRPDPADGRNSLITVTAAGRRLFESIMASRDDWLIRAIESAIGPGERARAPPAAAASSQPASPQPASPQPASPQPASRDEQPPGHSPFDSKENS